MEAGVNRGVSVAKVREEENVPGKTAAQRRLRTGVKREIKRKRKFNVTNGVVHSFF